MLQSTSLDAREEYYIKPSNTKYSKKHSLLQQGGAPLVHGCKILARCSTTISYSPKLPALANLPDRQKRQIFSDHILCFPPDFHRCVSAPKSRNVRYCILPKVSQ
jgi:hypothetical protein